MQKVKIVVDSSTDIPPDLVKALEIDVVPMTVTIDGKAYREGIELQIEDFYARFGGFSDLPKTSQPNLLDLVSYYRTAAEGGRAIVAIHLSSGLSGTYQAALLAKDMLAGEINIAAIDSRGASFGAGLLAIEAARLAQEGADLDQIVAATEQDRAKMRYIFTPDTLEYLIKGGRVSKLSGTIGSLLDIKPLLQITPDGKIASFGKVRGRKTALRKLAEVMATEISSPEGQTVGIAYSACRDDAELLAEEIRQRVMVKEIQFSKIGCTIGSHTGPGCVALFYRN
ncbi:MAG TPA: DegV family protein [Desulfobacteria bacterium]|nr:DegV family protein [Desulfobacteria bacterium]